MSDLPVREMVLYKHGVGFFVREGAVEGESVTLAFRQDEINDILKSLALVDRAGGQVLGVYYQTPMDRELRLANSSIRLSDTHSLRDLLRDLRGRQVTLTFNYPNSAETFTVSGRLIGIDEPPESSVFPARSDELAYPIMVSVLANDGQGVQVYPLTQLRTLTIHDELSQHDLHYFLDTSMSSDARRTVTVRLSPGDHQLVVHYVAPSPTWRVSYRLVAESEENGETGKALLQGWGLFDNRFEEDLEDVRVTLVAGQPISFIYDLYESFVPTRPTVKDETRIAPGPVEFGAASDDIMWMEDVGAAEMPQAFAKTAAPARFLAAAPRARAIDMSVEGMAGAAPPAAEAKEAGEFFQYIVTAPVSVKRGESALVPIIGSQISYSRELLYNGSKLPKHPVAALRFKNSSGLTLERGPVTVVEDNDYKGEAVIPFTKDGNEVYVPYAVELGVQITEHPQHSSETAGLKIEGAYLLFEEYQVYQVTYTLENTTAKTLTIMIEAPIHVGNELFDTRNADVETATERRWRVNVPARTRTQFVSKERHRTRRHEELRKLNYERLRQFLAKRWLDQTTYDELNEMLNNLGSIQQAQIERKKLEGQRDATYKQQEQLRANLQALQAAGQEATLRNRILTQLESSQNRLEAIDQQLEALRQQEERAEARVNQIIESLG